MPNYHESKLELEQIRQSSIFKSVLSEYKERLQKEANSLIRQQRFTEAYGEVQKFDCLDTIFKHIDNKIEQIEKEK
jgi:hypothetical protein